MGEVRDSLAERLRKLNPRALEQDLYIYIDAFLEYCEAAENLRKNGTIVAHPRTGSPIENPYLKVKAVAVGILRKYKLKTGELWAEHEVM